MMEEAVYLEAMQEGGIDEPGCEPAILAMASSDTVVDELASPVSPPELAPPVPFAAPAHDLRKRASTPPVPTWPRDKLPKWEDDGLSEAAVQSALRDTILQQRGMHSEPTTRAELESPMNEPPAQQSLLQARIDAQAAQLADREQELHDARASYDKAIKQSREDQREALQYERDMRRDLQGTVANLSTRFEELGSTLAATQKELAQARSDAAKQDTTVALVKQKLAQVKLIAGGQASSRLKRSMALAVALPVLAWFRERCPASFAVVKSIFQRVLLTALGLAAKGVLEGAKALAHVVMEPETRGSPPPLLMPPSRTVMMLAPDMPTELPLGDAGGHRAVMYDTGCTTIMTGALEGVQGELRELTGLPEYMTAEGKCSYEDAGTFRREIFGANGGVLAFTGEWLYNPKLPFDVVGKGWLKEHCGAFYVDSDEGFPLLVLRKCLDSSGEPVVLTLVKAEAGTEWLSYQKPPASVVRKALASMPNVKVPPLDVKQESTALQPTTTEQDVGDVTKVLTELEQTKLDHSVRGHCSLEKGNCSAEYTVGGPEGGWRQLAIALLCHSLANAALQGNITRAEGA